MMRSTRFARSAMRFVHVAVALLGTGVIVVGLQWLAHGGLSGP